jgi:hypothetical protein
MSTMPHSQSLGDEFAPAAFLSSSSDSRGAGKEDNEATDRDKLVVLSNDFFRVVKSYARGVRFEIAQNAVSLWCFKQPHSYQRSVFTTLGMHKVPLRPADDNELVGALHFFARQLHKENAACFFLCNDGLRLEDAYRKAGGVSHLIELGRSSFPKNRRLAYFHLFAMVNKAAVAAAGRWGDFMATYQRLFHSFIRTKPLGVMVENCLANALTDFSLKELSEDLRAGKKIKIVDSGMQGTFAIAVAAYLRDALGATPDQVDVHMFVVYPWLESLFRGRCISTDPSFLIALEKSSLKLRRFGEKALRKVA